MRAALLGGLRPGSIGRLIAALAAIASLWLLLGSGSALAAGESHPFLLEFGRSSTEAFTNPNGIAIDEASGDVYVADLGDDTVYKLDANGEPVDFTAGSAAGTSALTGEATPAHSFAFPEAPHTPAAIAVDNSTNPADPSRGDLYVMDAGHGVIDKFSPSGEYLSQITGFEPATGSAEVELLGLAVDANGTVRADVSGLPIRYFEYSKVEYGAAVEEFDDSAANNLIAHQINGKLAKKHETGLQEVRQEADAFAVGPTGDDYMVFASCSCTEKLGQQLSGLGLIDGYRSEDVALAADPESGHVYVDGAASVGEWDAGALNGSPHIPNSLEAEGEGVLVSRFGEGRLNSTAAEGGIAVNGATGEIYVANSADGSVDVFASKAPSVTAEPATSITKTSATLNGTVDPRSVSITACRFEYGQADGFGRASYEHTAPCTPEAAKLGVGVGASAVPVSARIEGLSAGLLYRFRLVAGNATAASESDGLLAAQGPGFGIRSFEVSFLNEDGSPDTQAGSHPYAFRNNIEFNWRYMPLESNADSPYVREPDGTLRDLKVDLPPGFVGDPNATAKKCTLAKLFEENAGSEKPEGGCPPESYVGTFQAKWDSHIYGYDELVEPVYNMATPRGVALQLGVNYINTDVFIDNGVLAGSDYPVQATVEGAPQEAPILRTQLTLSGVLTPCVVVPGEGGKYTNSSCTAPGKGSYETEPGRSKALLTLPTGCHGPLRSTIEEDSYQEPGHWVRAETVTRNAAGQPVSLTGCSKLIFLPTISAAPDTHNASSSTGLTVNVHVPQGASFNPNGLAESNLRDTTVTLPEGVAINPSGGNGLEACTSERGALGEGALGSAGDQIGYQGQQELNGEYEPGVSWSTFTPLLPSPLDPGANFCPDGSKIGTVKIKSPLLEHELEGAVYLATQDSNPFGSLIAMYLVAEDPFSGSVVKLAGEVSLTASGQIITTFKNTPDVPFENLELHFFGGERAPLATPSRCGTYTTTAVFTPWDGNGPVTSESSFAIEHGPGGGPCPGATLPFDPTVNAGATNIQAGAFSPLTVTMNRKDGEQNLKSIVAHLPPGLSGVLSGVELCPEPQANEGLCGQNSEVGEATIGVGVGNQPFTVTGGKFYLTGPYNGHGACKVGEAGCAPFGLTFEVPAKSGPFDLANTKNNHPRCDCVVVRGKVELDPLTSAITITSDPPGSPDSIPTSIEGIPLEIQHVNATTTRGDFQFNPTNCEKMVLEGTVLLSEGGTSTIRTPFQVTNCAALKFEPSFSASTQAKTSRKDGASLHVRLSYPQGAFGRDANIKEVKVELPKQLPSELKTLQHACLAAQFNANPAGCPEESVVGHAKAITPILPVPLEGPAYFVSYGGQKFPELVIVLQGYGVTIDLHGETFINGKTGVTSSTFKTVPDQPVQSFELTLPEGEYSALGAPGGKLCHKQRKLRMPTIFIGQNGAQIKQTTKIKVTGCKARHHKHKARKGKGKDKKHKSRRHGPNENGNEKKRG